MCDLFSITRDASSTAILQHLSWFSAASENIKQLNTFIMNAVPSTRLPKIITIDSLVAKIIPWCFFETQCMFFWYAASHAFFRRGHYI